MMIKTGVQNKAPNCVFALTVSTKEGATVKEVVKGLCGSGKKKVLQLMIKPQHMI